MQPTSLIAYDSIKPELGNKQCAVLAKFRAWGDMTGLEMADLLGWSINRVTGRINELVERKRLFDSGRTKLSKFGRPSIIWSVNEPSKQTELF